MGEPVEAELVPITAELNDIYHDDEIREESDRWIRLYNEFIKVFGSTPQLIARSPGRVNIIGEHIDYSLFPVLPMAIHADTLVAMETKETETEGCFKVQIANLDGQQFPKESWEEANDSDIAIDEKTHAWTNYFRAGLRGALKLLREKNGSGWQPRSMSIMVHGTVPPAGGLSSSAALVTACSLAVLYGQGMKRVEKLELTRLAIESERAVGVNSGGMDQSASVMSVKDAALYVQFAPSLSVRHVEFPKTNPPLVFMIAQSFVKADKKVSGPFHYNLRVVECTLAALMLLRQLLPKDEKLPNPLPQDDSPLNISLGAVSDLFWTNLYSDEHTRKRYPDAAEAGVGMIQRLDFFANELIDKVLPSETYSKKAIADTLGVTEDDLDQNFIKKRFPVPAERFRLRDRAKHVFSEAARVYKFMDLLETGPKAGESDLQFAERLGDLLNQSQQSCRDNFDCSTQDLDLICMHARDAGSLGSRLTGAGWGGATVHLVPASKVNSVRNALQRNYYHDMWVDGKRLTPEEIANAVIVTRPGSGSAIFHTSNDGIRAMDLSRHLK
ncbi:ribosomal protein S5 domain 2-type protein [Immersiella caudata]|uniref:Galactokinase n=1 Tax=Immersiella caudata TaxID=314043 RepID=A0AA40C7Q3_9PEZI|nr:ribosomal protein S5 domain 2-type protein [Immersiella caudata]